MRIATRILLVIAILTGIGALVIAHLKIEPAIKDLAEQKSKLTTDLATETAEKNKEKGEHTKTKDALDKKTNELADKNTQLDAKTKEAADLQTAKDGLTADLDKSRKETQTAKSENEEFAKLNKTVADITATYAKLAKTIEERDIFAQEKRILQTQVVKLSNDIINLKSRFEDVRVELPAGLTGKVLAYDPKYEFVVLDIGNNQGVKQNGEMIVSRDGKFIGKVRITTVQDNQSIANVLRKEKKSDVIEGDVCIVAN